MRVVFHDPACVDRVNNQLVNLGCSTEYSEIYKLLVVSISQDVKLTDVQGYLQTEASAGIIGYEEPILRQ